MLPNTAHGRVSSKIQCLRLLLHVSAGKRLWSQLWIWPLHTDYFKALIIHQGRREAKRKRVKKSLLVCISLSPWSICTHRHIKYAELGLALGHFSYISIKPYIIFLQLEAYDWCACDLFGLFYQPSKNCHVNSEWKMKMLKLRMHCFQMWPTI